ncbi:MAG: hypothetical protein ABI592_12765 [Acidobacteriota bacterium]
MSPVNVPTIDAVADGRIRAARGLAIAADVLQIAVFPLFGPGALSPWNDALDLLVAAALTRLVGWHWAFLPSFVAELVPGLDLVPTWTAAVLFATRGGAARKISRAGSVDAEVVSSVPRPPDVRP